MLRTRVESGPAFPIDTGRPPTLAPGGMGVSPHAGGYGITLDPQSGVRIGGADPRSDGAAIGY